MKEDIAVKVQKQLFELQDLKYRDFHAKLMPTIDKEKVIGVRTPALRSYAKQFGKTEEAKEFMKVLPHKYYEENNLHGMLLEQIKDYDELIIELEKFLPYIDNWATCDLLSLRIVKKNLEDFLEKINKYIKSDQPYTIRFGISMLMKHYLDDNFKIEYANKVAAVQSEEYYVNMMRAWYFATALAKQYDSIIPFIEEKKLDVWTHNKAIQKSIESYRITPEQTQYYFLSGFTAKLAGTERGITEPTPTFSACFGQAFLELHPTKYAEELVKKMEKSGAKAYLVNTGWNGTGKRISIKDTRGIIDAILSGAINEAPTKKIPMFDFEVPTELPGVDPAILDPRDTYADASEWETKAKDLAARFQKNFAKYEGNAAGKALVAAGPQL